MNIICDEYMTFFLYIYFSYFARPIKMRISNVNDISLEEIDFKCD